MKVLNILSFLFFSFSVLGQWVAYDSVGASVTTVRKAAFPDANTGYAICMENGSFDGRLVLNVTSPKQQQVINTQNWPEGFYIGSVETEKGERLHFKMQKK